MSYKGGKHNRSGFTIIEVMLALAISSALLVAVIGGLNSTLVRQRYYTAVEDSASIIKSQYDYATRIEINSRDTDNDYCSDFVSSLMGSGYVARNFNSGRGRSGCNVYGVVLTIGAEEGSMIQSSILVGINGEKDVAKDIAKQRFNLDDAQAEALLSNISDKAYMDLLYSSNLEYHNNSGAVDASQLLNPPDSNERVMTLVSSHKLGWGVKLRSINGNTAKAAVFIFRSPRDGAIHTYYVDYSDNATYNSLAIPNYSKPFPNTSADFRDHYIDIINTGIHTNSANLSSLGTSMMRTGENGHGLQLCIYSEDDGNRGHNARMLEFAVDGRSSAAVRLIDAESSENRCN